MKIWAGDITVRGIHVSWYLKLFIRGQIKQDFIHVIIAPPQCGLSTSEVMDCVIHT